MLLIKWTLYLLFSAGFTKAAFAFQPVPNLPVYEGHSSLSKIENHLAEYGNEQEVLYEDFERLPVYAPDDYIPPISNDFPLPPAHRLNSGPPGNKIHPRVQLLNPIHLPVSPRSQLPPQQEYIPVYRDGSIEAIERQFQLDSTHTEERIALKEGSGGVFHNTRPVHLLVQPKKKKKSKILAVDKGVYIPGGTQVVGKFPTLQSCIKACSLHPTCFAGDYNPWLKKCYFHGNNTACLTPQSHQKLTHFKKIFCEVPGVENFHINLGASLPLGFPIPGIDSLPKCLKHCQEAGGGISDSSVDLLLNPIFNRQICFGIDYDFATHRCFLHTLFERRDGFAQTLCAFVPVTPLQPIDLVPKDSVINILICPSGD